jgi:superfamily I DNA/RNA helicase
MMKPRAKAAAEDVASELEQAIQRILESKSRRKLVVAGPGTGKTTLFKKLLESSAGDKNSRLTLTFITNLKAELDKALSDLCQVATLHGYCQWLLRKTPAIRGGLTKSFVCQPEMASLIKDDWTYLRKESPPQFVHLMRDVVGDEELHFYFERANYYDAVDFDDSIYRTCAELKKHTESIPKYELVLIDEYQDFNRMEAGMIETLATASPIVIAGDDDQALYSQLRGASWQYIRALHKAEEYEVFELPFCMRCAEVIVGAVADVLSEARKIAKLEGRIEKPYKHFEPVKGEDSKLYPKIWLVETSVQRKNANYFGRFVNEAIEKIPTREIEEANKKGEPVVLVIGSVQYLRQVRDYLIKEGRNIESPPDHPSAISAERGLELLKQNPQSNLGWRIILEFRKKGLLISAVSQVDSKRPLYELVPEKLKEEILAEADAFDLPTSAGVPEGEAIEDKGATIKLTSFEGAKGLSAQHVFIIGLHAGDLPRDAKNIQDLEICKFLVGLTKTKKRCSLMFTKRFGDDFKTPSIFLTWIKEERFDGIEVNAAFWKSAKPLDSFCA